MQGVKLLLVVLVVTMIVYILGGCSTKRVLPLKAECNDNNQYVGDNGITFKMRADSKNNVFPVCLRNGEYYTISVENISDDWRDGKEKCGLSKKSGMDESGWDITWLPWWKRGIWLFEPLAKDCPTANWFELVGATLDEKGTVVQYRIGEGARSNRYFHYTGKGKGSLSVYVNDMTTRYDNNYGTMDIKIKKVRAENLASYSTYLLCED